MSAAIVQASAANERSIVEAEYEGLSMVVSPAEALRRVQELQAFVAKVMVQNVDYGTIPGTDKPSLFQPGAQKLAELYGLAWRFEDAQTTEDWDRAFFFYRKRCVISSRRDGRYVGDGIGSCNSREDRYAWRWLWDQPHGIDPKTLVTRRTKTGKTQWRVPNPDIYSLVNTIEKMACKRALVHAIIGCTRSSGVFTQDTEDLPREVFGEPEPARSWEKEQETPPPPQAPRMTEEQVKQVFAALRDADTEESLKEVGSTIGKLLKGGAVPKEHQQPLRDAYAARKKEIASATPRAASSEADRGDDADAY